MDPGFLASSGYMAWVTRLGTLDATWGGEAIIGLGDLMGTPHLRAWRCFDCQLLLVDLGLGLIYSDAESKAKWNPQ